ncbi:hypothetical protein [Pseudomonas fluorescens]|jgi:hypothetical protein|uniref:hypothetical protein n=1 Tax=Pseudomonas fluorescens TaxID=294 RepID=UPI00125C5928|nr:hypothetical protein [Pseudomonas fluorescens]VVP35345.1 hypothetical protein PS843_04509 [Pseudomonas fluorescens]
MKYQHNESGEPELRSGDFTKGKGASTSGPFPKNTVLSAPAKKRCTPAVAGVLASIYASYVKNLAVLGELELKEVKDQARIDRLKVNNEHLRETAQSYSSGVSLPDWKRRLPADAKRAFSFLGFAMMPDVQAFTFRLGHEVANAALSAKKGPTDYLSALIRTLGITDLAFVTEFASSDSEENHGFHIHGIARIPATISNQIIRQLLAPKQNLKLDPPIKGYRQRGDNKAIKVTELETPGAWALYSAKEFDFTAHCLQSNPDYASRSASQAGRELYEAIRVWVHS